MSTLPGEGGILPRNIPLTDEPDTAALQSYGNLVCSGKTDAIYFVWSPVSDLYSYLH